MMAPEYEALAAETWGSPALDEMREARRNLQDAVAERRDAVDSL